MRWLPENAYRDAAWVAQARKMAKTGEEHTICHFPAYTGPGTPTEAVTVCSCGLELASADEYTAHLAEQKRAALRRAREG